MAKLKIISNPYIKRVSFQSWDDNENLWKDISFENKNSSNSKLLREKLIKSFFPFKMNEIIDIIIEDYRIGDKKVDIIFEGTNDEYKELVELCRFDKYAETVSLTKSKKYLENARDILPEINELFDEKLRPLIMQSVRDYEKISKELAMYADASNDIIPICVLGNYSSGKSTFINALIGSEILPSGAEPITAKIYKIKQSSQSDRATVQFRFNEEPVKLRINDCEFMFTAGTSENNLTERIKSELACLDEPTLTLLVNKTLEIINEYASISSDDFISDIIEIEVPFISGLWGEATRQFVIFDTPGSNSATNVNHLVVLKEAMQGFTNGLPIFISELDKLDSTDNENLYNLIEEMKELDSRFTMIVVNKADSAELDRGGFSKEKEKKILRETIPKNLYAGGIYFVSSVIGLGAKNNGEFIDDHYAELFDEKKKKFSDTSSRFYKMLYSYNIMPEQLKKKTLDMAEQCQNILFANSGLFSVEKEIQNFAGKHSSYNKCQQSQLFLGKIIDITSNEIETAKTEREISKQHRDEQLKNDEKKLINEIEISSDKSQKDYVVEYDNYMESLDNEVIAVVSVKELKEREESIEQVKKAEHNYDTHSAEAKDSVDKMFEDLKNDGLNLFKKHNTEAFKTLGKNLSSGFTEMNKKREAVEQVQKSVDKETAKNLLESVTEEFKCNFDSAQKTLDEKSKQYWENKAQEFKNLLIKIVTGTNVLDEDKRQEIAEIIITYGSIVFENHAEEIFLGEDFKKGFKFFDIVLWESDKLDINKLSNKFNYEMSTNVTEMRKTIQTSHKDSFRKWKENLVSTIIANIVEYSPMLHSQAQIIKEETEKIHELESRQRQLSYYTESIRKMMDWKEIQCFFSVRRTDMGIKNMINKVGEKAGDKIAKLSALSPEQLKEVENNRDLYLSEMPDPNDSAAQELTMRLLAASGVEIFNAYLPQLSDLYIPIKNYAEYNGTFKSDYNIRYFNITKWVTDKKENNLEKLVNVYEVLSNEECNIALVFNRKCDTTNVYLAVTNTKNSDNSADVNIYKKRLVNAISGNFPGSELKEVGVGAIPCIDRRTNYSVASASNIPTEKSEKFISQTIEKLLDGFAPDTEEEEYSLILLATPIQDVEERKLRLSEIYSGLAPYASWETSYQYSENKSVGSQAQVGVNVGASAGIQNGQNQSITNTDGTTENESKTDTESKGKSETETSGNSYSESNTHTDGSSTSHTDSSGSSDSTGASLVASYQHGWNRGVSDTVSKNISDEVTEGVTNSASRAVANSVGTALAKTLGKAVTKSVAKTAGVFSSTNFGVNFGASFARSSSITATIGKNEGITQHYTNFNIKNALELLESQMKRFEQSMALGMWDFAAYVISEDHNIANNVAHSYISLTQGEESYLSQASINLWRGDIEECAEETKEIVSHLRELRHPVFGLNPAVTAADPKFNVYPSIVTATTSLSGKELAYSLNFPQKSVAGLPVIECTEFGRNIVTYDDNYKDSEKLELGSIFHMNRVEKVKVEIAKQSLASHTFITGSTGSGKSNTVYKMLNEAVDKGVKFLVVEPAKGEYKTVFGSDKDVFVYGTNPNITPLLRINPFSFPDGIHILEHLDRLVEIFNVCWPMYAAMPAVLKKAIEKAYSDCGWNLCTSKNKYDENLFPCFADVAENIKTIIDQSDYDNDNKGAYKGALKTRLESLTNGINGMIFVQNEINPQKLFEENVIVDLSRVGSTETKSLLMGMLVLKLQEYRMTTATGINAPLKHITVLEEAHNLLKRTSQESISESSNLLGKSVEMLANAIAEMRTYGEGFIIVDQAPGLLDMSTIRNTNTKIIMRLPDLGDRELVGKSANLNDDQIAELAKLPCGVAAVYQNEWIQPVLCKVERFDKETTPYTFVPDENDDIYTCTENTAVSLLDCIMNNEIFRKGDKEDIKKLKFLILNSKLRTVVKRDFIEYIETEKDNTFNTLRKLVYDFLSASEAISRSQANTNLSDLDYSQ